MLDTPVIVSDEEIKEGDWYVRLQHIIGKDTDLEFNIDIDIFQRKTSTRNKELFISEGWINGIKDGLQHNCDIIHCRKIIAGIEGLASINWNELEDEFGWADVDYIIKSVCGYDKNVPLPDNDNEVEVAREVIKHFKKAQSLNNKKFSLEDIEKAIEMATWINPNNTTNFYSKEEIIQSLQQPKVFEIEIEMEEYDHDEDWSEISGAFEICKYRPKITNNSIKILRKL